MSDNTIYLLIIISGSITILFNILILINVEQQRRRVPFHKDEKDRDR